jgi:pseudaminic acid biosynthesis-associated methylase
MATTKQVDLWRSDFGADYAERGNNRITAEGQRLLMRDWGKMLAHAVTPAPQSVLEVGCNIGRNLLALTHFIPEIHGVEPNPKACAIARGFPELAQAKITEGDGFALPYGDGAIDLVFTSGVLIHVAPDNLGRMVDEVVRVSRRYILCIEYFSHQPEAAPYHGMEGFLFKRDFGRFYLERHPGLRVLDYGFLWQALDSSDDSNWWLFAKE